MSPPVDASFVDLHRCAAGPLMVDRVEGLAHRVRDGVEPEVVHGGMLLEVGDTLSLAAGAEVRAGKMAFSGGKRGRAHALVAAHAFRTSPNRSDVPQLLEQLAQIEIQGGLDPLAAQPKPRTSYERAAAAEFAHLNLSLTTARLLSEPAARELRAVVLFASDDTVFVAFDSVDAAKLRTVMENLERPASAHMVTPDVLDALLSRVYGRGASELLE